MMSSGQGTDREGGNSAAGAQTGLQKKERGELEDQTQKKGV